ncbi:MAG: sensor histidine kinase [Abditibacteriales bacterium]|nr:sensor histidine kinase [Abditibacteriales bacterium]MDW8367843.1 sensor histidine kinase [Abditibacteriales bacterium]
MKSLPLANRKLWQRVLSVSIRAKILGMVGGILLYWVVLVIARRFLIAHVAGPEAEARTFADTLLLVSIFLFLPPSLLVAYLLTRAMTTPILELTRVAEAVRRGDLSQRVRGTYYGDEIGNLSVTFNRMLDELSRAMEEIRRHSAAQTHLFRRLVGVQEEERRRVAHELHDRTSQLLASLTVYLQVLRETVQEEEVKERVKQVQDLVTQLMQDIHQLSWELRPSALDSFGLVVALDNFIKERSQRRGLPIDFHVRGFAGERLPAHLETTLYRIVQEALTNIFKHAEATRASVILERTPQKVRAIIEDQGRGFDVEAVRNSPPEKHLGLLGMEERVDMMGGRLQIESTPGIGTTVFVELPLS